MQEDYIVFGSPHIEQAEIDEVVACLKSGWLSTGPRVIKFEKAFSEYVGVKHALAVNSCTAGLHLGMLAAGIGPGDEVITTPLTFAATGNVICHVGARPVFVDISAHDMNIDPTKIELAITDKTKAIIPVHLAGYPCDMDAICAISKKHGLTVISDAAHAVEGKYRGTHVGACKHLAVFSFYATKNLVTGEGGMVTTNVDVWAEKIKVLALHGLNRGAWDRYSDAGFKHYQVVLPGYKYNMMDIQAALGLHQLDRVERNLARREAIWARYDDAFADSPFITPPVPTADVRHARHLYPLLVDENLAGVTRDDFQAKLHEKRIGTGVHFVALHLHPYYRNKFGYELGDLPVSELISHQTVSLPLSSKLTEVEVERIIEAAKSCLGSKAKTSKAPRSLGAA